MTAVRERIDGGFRALARGLIQWRWLVLLALVAGTAGLVSQLPKLTSDNSVESFFRADDPALMAFNEMRAEFGQDAMIFVLVEPPAVFDAAFLQRLDALHEALEAEVPYLQEATSLMNARYTHGSRDELIVEDLVETIPRTPEATAALRERVLNHELYPNLYVSPDGSLTAVVLELLAHAPDADPLDLSAAGADPFASVADVGDGATAPSLSEAKVAEALQATRDVMARFEAPDFRLSVTGQPAVNAYFDEAIARDVGLFMTLAFAAFAVLLLLLFRRVAGVVLPFVVVIFSLLSAIALMAVTGAPFTSVTSILPSLLTAVGVGSSVHLLVVFFRNLRQQGDRRAAIEFALGHSGLPILMTGLTTAAGLASFATTTLTPVANLGIYGAVGVLLCLAFTLLLLPALLAILPLRGRGGQATPTRAPLSDRLLEGIAAFATNHAAAIVAVSALILALAGAGLAQQHFAQNQVAWLPASTPVRQALDTVDERVGGATTVQIVVDTGRENGLYDPAVLQGMDALAQAALDYRKPDGTPLAGKTFSVVDVVKESNRALNGNDPAAYRIPDDRALVAQELLLFETSGSNDLESLVDTQFSEARLTAKVFNDDAVNYIAYGEYLEAAAARLLPPGVEVTVTGGMSLFAQTIQEVMVSLARSYGAAAVIITLLMVLMLGSLRMGLLSMVPNVAPIVVTLGVMGWLDIPLDMSNMLVGTVAIGLAVDDTIHFFHNFRREYTRTGDAAEATRLTMLGTGRAMVFTTIVLVLGFLLFVFASLNNLVQFGALVGLTLVLALLADVLLAPALMTVITRSRHGREVAAKWVHTSPEAG